MVEGGRVHGVCKAFEILRKQTMTAELGGNGHAPSRPDLPPDASGNSKARVACYPHELNPVGLFLADVYAIALIDLPIPVAYLKLSSGCLQSSGRQYCNV